MTFKKIQLYYNTLKYLRRKQIAYRLWYFIRSRGRKLRGFSYKFTETPPLSIHTNFEASIASYTSYFGKSHFKFLNLSQKFEQGINWEFGDYGKLWTYNLAYFDFLNQKDSDTFKSDFKIIIDDFIQKQTHLKNAVEPFPISLRGINWIKYFSQNNIQNPDYDRSLFRQYQILADNIEYHLLGNHLLENGFSFLFGAVYFQHAPFFKIANGILTSELNEQILADGAHFELCPMYHKIMLFRTMDCYNLLKNNPLNAPSVSDKEKAALEKLLYDKAVLMLAWLSNMTYSDGTTPHFGDSTDGIAPTATELFDYAQRLNLINPNIPLSHSGFRKLKNQNFELVAKIGQIGPDYIPGHAHADSLSFELHIKGKPVLVDTGISTYEANERRQKERSTSSHNTLEIKEQNSSEVWGSFRVANRAKTKILKDTPTELCAEHDGYKKWGSTHKRQFILKEDSVEIIDETAKEVESKVHWHFPPFVIPSLDKDCIYFEGGMIQFLINKKDNSTIEKIEVLDYFYPPQYNILLEAKKVTVTFKGTLQTLISYL